MLAISLIPIIISRKIDLHFSHTIINNIRNKRFEDDYLRKTYLKKLENMSRCTRSLAKFKKLYKVEEQHVADNYADRKMKEFVELYKALKKTKNSEEIESFNRNILRRTKSDKIKKFKFNTNDHFKDNQEVLNINKWTKNVEIVEEEKKEVSFISARVETVIVPEVIIHNENDNSNN
jgi:hypothetical protein